MSLPTRQSALSLYADDGRRLAATLFEPSAPPQAAIVVCGALGVPRRYYRSFASWMAERGVAVLTFDYRGSGESLDGPIRQDPATLYDWGRYDMDAAITAARSRWPDAPTWALCHSFGGQALGLTPHRAELSGAIVVASASGDMALYDTRFGHVMRFTMHVAIPAVTRAVGYMPGRLGLGTDLPAGVVRQWSEWCRTPNYLVGALGETGHADLAIPMHFFRIADDTYAPERPARALEGWYQRATVRSRTLHPREVGLRKLGHFGLFRPGKTVAFWQEFHAIIASNFP